MEELLKQLMDQMNSRFDKLDTDIKFLKEAVAENSTENRSHFKHIESKLEEQQRIFKVVEDELKKVNIDIEYLGSKLGKNELDINSLNKRIQS